MWELALVRGSGPGSGCPEVHWGHWGSDKNLGSIPEVARAAEVEEASGSLAAAFLTSLSGLPQAGPVDRGPQPACPLPWGIVAGRPGRWRLKLQALRHLCPGHSCPTGRREPCSHSPLAGSPPHRYGGTVAFP